METSPAQEFHRWVMRQLEAKGWTVADLARVANIARPTFGKWQRAESTVTVEMVRRVTKALGVHETMFLSICVVADVLEPDEIGGTSRVVPDLALVRDSELLRELAIRLAARNNPPRAAQPEPQDTTLTG